MYELLAEPIRRYIRDKKWESLRSIQNAAIEHIMASDRNFILASRTASGKTEAAFLPILSKADFRKAGVKVLYISPLIALINDQFLRIQDLCNYLEVPVTKWHGEASKSEKDKLVRNPAGVLLITPESLEAMFANQPQQIRHFFSALEYVVIDEIHSFLGTPRGVQLQSLLSRLRLDSGSAFKLVGLSATIGDYGAVKTMTGDAENTTVLRDKTAKEMEAAFKYFEGAGTELPLELLKDLYKNTCDHKVLIFPNSRGRAEEIAVKLKKIAERVGGHGYYFSHHSSVDREVREYVEQFAKGNQRYPFAISCTSTLELGIDIGTVDMVVQVDATASIASLIQRVGRSGRKDGAASRLLFYATEPWSLFQSLACFSLYREGFVEPTGNDPEAYDILLHQLLSTVKQLSACSYPELKKRLTSNHAFKAIAPAVVDEITKALLASGILELVGNELIIGLDGERLVNARDFYAVFRTDPNYKVVCQDKPVGEIPLTSLISVDENIFLAARIWKVVDIDEQSRKILVIPAPDGKKPKFPGSGMDVYGKVREKMLELLLSEEQWPELDEKAAEVLAEFRKTFAHYPIEDLAFDRPLIVKEKDCILYTFASSKINRALHFLLTRLASATVIQLREQESALIFACDQVQTAQFLTDAIANLGAVDDWLREAVSANPEAMVPSKWGIYLPLDLQVALLKRTFYDFTGLEVFLTHLKMISYDGGR